jgi:hypothetical protein
MAKRGFVASMDAIFALMLAFMFVSVTLTTVNQRFTPLASQPQRQAMDLLTVLEYSDSFYSPSATMAETSNAICARLEIYNGTSTNMVAEFVKTSCPHSDPDEKAAWRTFVRGDQFMTARMVIWFKEG